MKKLFLFFVAISLAQISFSQTVPLDSVAKYEGKKITVCSKVIGTHVSSGDKKNTYINIANPHPHNTSTVMISDDDAVKFKYVRADFNFTPSSPEIITVNVLS